MTGCRRSAEPEPPLLVFAAASLRDVMVDLTTAFSTTRSERIDFNFGGSTALARQIIATRGADAFVSAAEEPVQDLERAGLVTPGTARVLTCNRLVVVGGPAAPAIDKPERLGDPDVDAIVIADPAAAPAGVYAKRWLEAVPMAGGSLFSKLSGRLVVAPDVRAALALVRARGSAVGIVYASDAASTPAVRVLYEPHGPSVPRVSYVGAPIAGRPRVARAAAFVDYLASGDARGRFERAGFVSCSEASGPGQP